MRRILWLFLVLVFIMSFDGVSADNSISVIANGMPIESEEKPRLKNGVVMVSIEPILQAMGIRYKNVGINKLSIEVGDAELVITAGSIVVERAKRNIYMDAAASLSQGKILVPATFFRQVFGHDVSWDASTGTVKIRSQKYSDSDLIVKELYPNVKGLSSEQMMRALAADGISVHSERRSFYYLGGASPTYLIIQSRKETLKQWWSIESREDAEEMIKWLAVEGYRGYFNQLSELLDTLPEEKYKEMLEYYAYDTKLQDQIKFIKEKYKALGQKSLNAWDHCNLINMAGLCYIAGYITEEEAWELTMLAAQVLQENFSSWEDMGKNYLAGYRFMIGKEDEGLKETLKWLLNDQKSPWVKYRWDLPLKREEVKDL